MKAKKYTAGMLVLSGALLLAACGKQPAAPDKVYVGVASYDGGDVFIGELIDCLKEQLNGFSGGRNGDNGDSPGCGRLPAHPERSGEGTDR